jgi:hypothetical protein
MTRINRRQFAGLTGALTLAPAASAAALGRNMVVPDDGWQLWLDRSANWQDDAIYLPDDVNLKTMPVNPPTGGWKVLQDGGIAVTLPSTVEQHCWGASRPYTRFKTGLTRACPGGGATLRFQQALKAVA